ncbi:MAG: class I SAM-dependent methyltransferase [Candidatus Diapherotrites archaeon]
MCAKIIDTMASWIYSKPLLRKKWYGYLSRLDREGQVTFMNLGYAGIGAEKGMPVEKKGEHESYGELLYNRVAGNAKLCGLDVLEIGCGRGGGAAYTMKKFMPKKMVAADLCKEAIDFCKKNYEIKGLSFEREDAQKLSFANSSFDSVLSVESSHGYASMEKFLREVNRVLKQDGCFLFADFRGKNELKKLHAQMERAGFEFEKQEMITENVAKAIELDSERKQALIERLVPKRLRKPFVLFAGIKGTPMHEALVKGEIEYVSAVLRKTEAP